MKKLDEKRLEDLTDKTNRSKGQTQFLYELLDGDFEKLCLLEQKVKEKYVAYCPSTLDEVTKILE